MKVAHVSDYDTHAVIGGKEIESFGIAQTAEFFTVLSSTLYSNKPLAVVRETLCNAWDSHIVSGITLRAVQVTVTDDKLIIRDFGAGIPHDLIHQIYCVYGNSTKENDGNQTGGFGLGSKSPFAYSDHFTVSNHFGGLKTVHAISKGSARTQGKPDRRVMVSVPTTETGVEVMIPVKSAADKNMFIKLVQQVAGFGEMNVELNGNLVPKIPISQAEGNMFLTTQTQGVSINKINVRYGNVVYPVLPDAEYIGVYSKLAELMKEIPAKDRWNENSFCLIMQAQPNTISVTPSRESLSLTETTIDTLKELMNGVIEYMSTGTAMFEEMILNEQSKAINHMWSMGYADRVMYAENLLSDNKGPKSIVEGTMNPFGEIKNLLELANYYLRYQHEKSDRIIKLLRLQRINMMIEAGFRRQTDLKTVKWIINLTNRKEIKKRGRYGLSKTTDGDLYRKEVLIPLVRRLAAHPDLNAKHLYVVTPKARSGNRAGWSNVGNSEPDMKRIMELSQGVVVITHNRLAYEDDFWTVMKTLRDHITPEQAHLVYVAPRTKGTKEAAIAEFERLGYLVIDFASAVDAYRDVGKDIAPRIKLQSAPAPYRPKPKGIQSMASLIYQGKFTPNGHLIEDNDKRITDYDYIIRPHDLAGRGYSPAKFFPWGDNYAKDIVRMYGARTVVCVSDPQMESQRKKGKKDALPMIAQAVVDEVLTNPAIRTYVENELGEREARGEGFSNIIRMCQHSLVLRKALGFTVEPTANDLRVYELFLQMVKSIGRMTYSKDGTWEKIIGDAKAIVDTWKAPQRYVDLSKRIKESKAIGMLDMYDMENALEEMYVSKKENIKLKTFIEMAVLNALNI